MALIKCKECGKEVSDKASNCPNCGCPIESIGKENDVSEEKKPVEELEVFNQNSQESQIHKTKQRISIFGIIALIFGIFACMFICVPAVGIISAFIGVIFFVLSNGIEKNADRRIAYIGLVLSCATLVLCFIFLGVSNKNSDVSSDDVVAETPQPEQGEEDNAVQTEANSEEDSTGDEKQEWEKHYEKADVKYVDINFLYKNAEYYKDSIIISISNVYEIGNSDLQFDINDENFFKEFTCTFKDGKDISSLKEGEKVCFIGKVSAIDSYFGTNTITMDDCFLVSKGEDVLEYEKKIEKNAKKQKKFVKNAKKKKEKKAETEEKDKKNSYIKGCESYSYNEIQRKPKEYKGKKIKVSGTVIQVMEGLFDTVVLRVEDSDGNIWYVDYSYSNDEAKILENDTITVYGKSTGTETYVTVLGNSETIPSIEAKYID